MSSLSRLKLVSCKRAVTNNPTVIRRAKLAAKLQEQADLVSAKTNGQSFAPTRSKWIVDNESGEEKLVHVPKRVREWFWVADNGKVNLSVKYGSKVIEISKGKNAIEVSSSEELHSTLVLLREATLNGELDQQIEAASVSLRKGFGR